MEGHILVVRPEWLNCVFLRSTYYTGFRAARGWKPGDMVFLVSRTEIGQCFVAYGTIKRIRTELTEEEKAFCLENGWDTAVELEDIREVSPPVPVEETPVGAWGLWGRFLHGRKVSDEDLKGLLEALGYGI